MSETDSFIDEVTEEVRRDKLFALFRKYGWIGIAAVLLIVGGAAWNEWQKARAEAAAQAFGDQILQAVNNPDAGARAGALAGLAADGAGRAMVLAFLTAADAAEAGQADVALKALKTIADDAGADDLYRQLALYKMVTLPGAALAAGDRAKALETLAVPGGPFRLLAQEQQALDLLADGKTDEAVALLDRIRQDAEATPGVQGRAEQLLTALGKAPVSQ